jgi:predicted MFS family arabinose efflux permease
VPEDVPDDAAVPDGVRAGHDWRRDVGLLRRREVWLVFSSRLVSDLGSGIAPIALAFGVLDLPGADAGDLGLVLFAAALPRVLFMLFGGVVADRLDRGRVMVSAEVLAGLAQLLAGALLLTGTASIAWLCALAVLNGTAFSLFYPAYAGLVPSLVADPRDLQSANALLRLSTNIAAILGTALGGLLVATIGAGWALVADSATFLLSAALIWALGERARGRVETTTSMLTDLRDGWREFTARRWVWGVVLLFSLMNIGFGAALGVVGPVQALESWNGAPTWAFLLACFSVGTVAGVVVAMRLRPSRPLLVAMCVAPVMATPVIALAPPWPVAVVAVLAFAAGVASDVFEVLWITALQNNIPADALSRVSSYDYLGSLAFVPIGLAVSGWAVATFGVEATMWACAALCLTSVVGLLDPQVRGLRAGRADGLEPAGA